MPGQRKMIIIMAVIFKVILAALGIVLFFVILVVAAAIILIVGSDLGMENTIYFEVWQVPRPPGADDLYEGIYEDFVKEEKKGGRD